MATKNLVIYHFFEKDVSYRDNLLHFLIFGICKELDYIFVISGEHNIDLPILENIRYVFNEPKRSDFGGYAELINIGLDIGPYQHVFFINSSVRGPFIPAYKIQPWYEIFLGQMKEDVGMVGSSICILKDNFRHSVNYQARFGGTPPYSHVQTMAYALRQSVLTELIAQGFYRDNRDVTKTLAIEDYEIHLSQLVLKQGWNLRCLLPELNQIDYRLPHVNPNPTSTVGDPNEVLGYFGRSVHPYEILFIKTNRHLYTEPYLDRLTYSMLQSGYWKLDSPIFDSVSIREYVERIRHLALSVDSVLDFSYVPEYINNKLALNIARQELEDARALLANLLVSSSWRVTKPLRDFKNWIAKISL